MKNLIAAANAKYIREAKKSWLTEGATVLTPFGAAETVRLIDGNFAWVSRDGVAPRRVAIVNLKPVSR